MFVGIAGPSGSVDTVKVLLHVPSPELFCALTRYLCSDPGINPVELYDVLVTFEAITPSTSMS